jgi:hypothetical protein
MPPPKKGLTPGKKAAATAEPTVKQSTRQLAKRTWQQEAAQAEELAGARPPKKGRKQSPDSDKGAKSKKKLRRTKTKPPTTPPRAEQADEADNTEEDLLSAHPGDTESTEGEEDNTQAHLPKSASTRASTPPPQNPEAVTSLPIFTDAARIMPTQLSEQPDIFWEQLRAGLARIPPQNRDDGQAPRQDSQMTGGWPYTHTPHQSIIVKSHGQNSKPSRPLA